MACIVVEVSDLATVYGLCGSDIYMHMIAYDMMKTTIDLSLYIYREKNLKLVNLQCIFEWSQTNDVHVITSSTN